MSVLALLGGEKAKNKPFPLWPYYDEHERRALMEVLESLCTGGELRNQDAGV